MTEKTETRVSDYAQFRRARNLARVLRWREDGDATPLPAGDVGGDLQLDGEAYSRAWWAELPNGLFARIEASLFIGEAPATRHGDTPADPARSIHEQVEYLICRDRANPGDEVASDYGYDTDYAPGYAPTDENVLYLCRQYDADTVTWSEEDRILRVLFHGLPTVTDTGPAPIPAHLTRLWIGVVCIGTVTRVNLDTGLAYIAQAHDWDGGNPIPIAEDGMPGEDYDPMHAGLYADPSEAVTEVVSRVPATLSRHLYSPAIRDTIETT